MSETRLNVGITATNTATPTIQQLNTTLEQLKALLVQVGDAAKASVQAHIAAVEKQISAQGGLIASTKIVTATFQEQIASQRTLTEGFMAYSGAVGQATQSNALAYQKFRNEILKTEEALIRQKAVLRELSGASFFEAFAARQGIGRQAFSAAGSVLAEQLRAEAAIVGEKLTLTPRAGFSRLVADLAGVKQSYLSAAESAKVFQNAGMMAEERVSAGSIFSRLFGSPRMIRHGVAIPDAFARGQTGQAIASIGAAMRDAGLGAGALAAGFGGLIAIMSTGAILRGAENLGRWATETRAAASAAGMSLEKYSALQGALTLTGLKSTEADAALRRLAENISTAIEDPTSKAAQGFNALGISQEQLTKTGGDADQVLRLLAAAFVRTADGANKSAAMEAVAGKGFETLIPLLQKGSSGLDEAEAKARRLGLTLDEKTSKSLEETGQAVIGLGERIRGDGIKAMEAWGPTIQGLVKLLEGLADVIGIVVSGLGKLASLASIGGRLGSAAAQALGSALGYPTEGTLTSSDAMRDRLAGGGKVAVPAMSGITAMERLRNEIAAAKAGATGGTSEALRLNALNDEIAVIRKVLSEEKLSAKQREDITTELNNKLYELHSSQVSSGTRAAKQTYADFAAAEKLKISEAEGSTQKIKAIYEEWANAAKTIYKQHASVVLQIEREKQQALNAARLSDLQETEKVQDQQTKLMLLNARLATLMAGGGARLDERGQGPAMDMQRAAAARQEAAQVEALAQQRIADRQAIINSSIQGSEVQKRAQEEIGSILVQSKQQEIALYQRAADATAQATRKITEPFLQFFNQVGSQFESFTSKIFNALLSPQTELVKRGFTSIKVSEQGNEIRAAFRSIFLGIAGDFAKSMQSAVGQIAARALSGGAANTMGELLSNWLSRAVSSIVPSLAGGATAAAGSTAVTAAVTAGSGSIVAAIGASTTAIVTAVTANTLKPSIAGFSFASGGIVPSAAGGMIVGGNGGTLAVLHAREMVLPAQISQGLQSIIQRSTTGGAHNNATLNYAPTINTGARGRSGSGMTRSEFAQLMGVHGGAMLGEARNMIRNGWRPA